jgi:putative alpha-1,2-mannosidase
LFNSFLFNYSGKPWLSQKWSRLICQEFYGTEPLHGYGFGQDEDQGQLGAWYVLSAIGLFDVAGHATSNPVFQLGSPQFDRISIALDPNYYEGKKLIIETINNSPENLYIQSASLNGKPFEESWIDRNVLMKGANLKLEMGPNPNTERGRGLVPPSMSNEE